VAALSTLEQDELITKLLTDDDVQSRIATIDVRKYDLLKTFIVAVLYFKSTRKYYKWLNKEYELGYIIQGLDEVHQTLNIHPESFHTAVTVLDKQGGRGFVPILLAIRKSQDNLYVRLFNPKTSDLALPPPRPEGYPQAQFPAVICAVPNHPNIYTMTDTMDAPHTAVRICQLHLAGVKLITSNRNRCNMCHWCGRRQGKLKLCSGCRLVHFCSTECAQKLWKDSHKAWCRRVVQFNQLLQLE
jgi:hypothetical protein